MLIMNLGLTHIFYTMACFCCVYYFVIELLNVLGLFLFFLFFFFLSNKFWPINHNSFYSIQFNSIRFDSKTNKKRTGWLATLTDQMHFCLGHFYFFNSITKEAKWSLPFDVFENPNDKDPSHLPSPCTHEQEHLPPVNSGVMRCREASPQRPGWGPRTRSTLDLNVLDAALSDVGSTPDGFHLKNVDHNQLETLRDSLANTAGMSSGASSEPLR